MKNILFLAAGAAALSLASCSQEKTSETTTTTTTMPAEGTAMAPADMDAMYQARAQRIADKFYQDMKITDEAAKEKIRTAYYNRSKRMATMKTKYTADTTGMAAAMREANMETDTEFKTILVDPTQYQAYESSRSTYDESNYMDDNTSSSMAPAGDAAAGTTTDASMSSGSAMSGTAATGADKMATMEKGKAKMADGSKMKMKADGDVKMRDADGNKTKVAGDDGTVKMKGDGEKTKMK